jgi:hypothetical protein
MLLGAICLLAAGSLLHAQDAPKAEEPKAEEPKKVDPSPLSGEQLDRIRTLVQRTQARDAELKTALETKQRELARAYTSFELDEARVTALEEEIVGLQRQLLGNYHTLHVELRKIVGPERFATLIQRINLLLKPAQPGETRPVDRPKARAAETPKK